MLGFDIELGATHLGVGYARNNRKAHNETVYFGTGQATIDMKTYQIYAEHLWKNVRFGLAYYLTEVDGFTEVGSRYDVAVDPFHIKDMEAFIDIYHKGFYVGVSNYTSIGSNKIGFQGLNYRHKDNDIRFRLGYEITF